MCDYFYLFLFTSGPLPILEQVFYFSWLDGAVQLHHSQQARRSRAEVVRGESGVWLLQ